MANTAGGTWAELGLDFNIYETLHINLLELLTSLAFSSALRTLHDVQLNVFNDNKTTVSWLKKMRGRNPIVIQCLKLITNPIIVENKLSWNPIWLSTNDNFIADAFSRDEVTADLGCTSYACVPCLFYEIS